MPSDADLPMISDPPVARAVPAELVRAESPAQSAPVPRIPAPFYGLSLGLFGATCLTTFFAGTMTAAGDPRTLSFDDWYRAGIEFSVCAMGILLCHELGHYLQALRYGIPALPPLFIPMPLSPFGTMGAVIVQQGGVGNRRQIFDIAVSGPLAGLAVTLPVLYYGLSQATYQDFSSADGAWVLGDPPLLLWMSEWVLGPKPEGTDVVLNPALMAGWLGVFITALNLVPVGQLDGGHLLYTLIGKWAHVVARVVVYGAFAVMLVTGSYSYLPMLFLIGMIGMRHPPTADDSVPIGWTRTIIGWGTLSFLLVGFTPDPFTILEPAPGAPAQREEPLPFPRLPLQPGEIVV